MTQLTCASRRAIDTPTANVDQTWRASAFLPLSKAAVVLGVSRPSLYSLARAGKLEFRRLAGRTLVSTPSLAVLVDAQEAPWAPSKAGAAARKARADRARANRQEAADAA